MGLRQTDEKIASKEAGLDLKLCTTSEIQTHLDDFGLVQEFGTYGKIRGLSGGQKVKLVLAAAMWNCPHLLVLDEPTNYLDREALGALSSALNKWGGAVLMISHNKEFYSSVCKEEWLCADGKVTVQGDSDEREMKAVAKKRTAVIPRWKRQEGIRMRTETSTRMPLPTSGDRLCLRRRRDSMTRQRRRVMSL